jgi:NTE family protein
VLRLLADVGLLSQVRYSSSVSGGSVANGVFACGYERLAESGFTGEAFDELVLDPFVAYVSRRSLSRGMARQAWRILGRRTRTDLLQAEFDRVFFRGRRLEDLPQACRFIFNAANTSSSARFGFEREVVGDYVIGEVRTAGTGLRVAQAVAASAAVPGLLAPLVLDGLTFPCPRGTVRLVDGGVYDNMGLEPLDRLDNLLVVLNAGGMFQIGQRGRVPLIRDLQLAQSLLYRQTTALRRREMVDRFREHEAARDAGSAPPAWSRRGVLFQLTTTMDRRLAPAWAKTNPRAPDPNEVAFVRTSFDRFSSDLCRKLVYAGWWLTGANLATYHPDVLPGELPRWRELT